MAHPLDHAIASDLSYLVLEKQRRESEVTLPPLHQAKEVRQSFGGAVDTGVLLTHDGSETETPIWHFRGRRKGRG